MKQWGKIVVKMEGNPPRQIFMTLKVVLSIKHNSFINFPVTCEYSNLPGNFSNQPMTSGPLPETSMFGRNIDFIINP